MIGRIATLVIALGMAVAGAWLAWGGFWLIVEGGSWYYLPAGAGLIGAAVGLARKRTWTWPLYGALLTVTLIWALWEAGLDLWPLVARLVAPVVLGLLLLLPFVRRGGDPRARPLARSVALPVAASVAALLAAGFIGEKPGEGLKPAQLVRETPETEGEWKQWGRTLEGNRYSPLNQITAENISHLRPEWEYKSNVEPYAFHSFQATPLMADGKLYTCLDRNVVVALDAEHGKELWRFDPKAKLDGVFAAICRGVALYEAPAGTQECPKRVLFGVADGRMMALDAASGQVCRSFGNGGAVDLKAGLGPMDAGAVFPSSPPTVVNGVAMINGWVNDGNQIKEPSGGVRAYDAVTGALRWVWDAGREEPQKPLAEGETYTRGAPNAWGVYSGDEALGLVYFGTGVETPDYFGAQRSPGAEKYSTSILALDVKTGKPRWHFQTVHHDIWDWDVSPQPVLTELTRNGEKIPALIGPTKRGQFFVLDRRTGTPIFPVTEKPVPQGAVKEDWTSKTQPYSDAFANVAGDRLTERTMWGATPLDQLWCRLKFRRARYEGDFTPPGLKDAIFYPGSAGGSNWHSAAVDAGRGLLVVNSLYMPDIGHLIPRAEADKMVAEANTSGHANAFAFPQKGTPYAMDRQVFLGPLGVPCIQPPYGRLTAIDLATGKKVWSVALGDASAAGPMGIESKLPIRMGMPNLGGTVVTAGGLAFVAATQDRKIRAFDLGTGKEVWSHKLPAVGAATPMSYRSPVTRRQYVVIAAGGHPALPGPAGSSLVAFALPMPLGDK